MAPVIATLPRPELARAGWALETIVVDNGSTDGTADIARALGARVVHQPLRGYGNAYRAGFAAATGDLIVTGDADRTYPFDHVPTLLEWFLRDDLEFLTTNRLMLSNREAMSASHNVGNHLLSAFSRLLFHNGIIDSQSGMWMFRRSLLPRLDLRSPGMAFSQEIKNEAFRRSGHCREVPIEYRPRGGTVKLHAGRDGARNASQLVAHRFRRTAQAVRSPGSDRAVTAPAALPHTSAGFSRTSSHREAQSVTALPSTQSVSLKEINRIGVDDRG
jgi:hypothetical protein